MRELSHRGGMGAQAHLEGGGGRKLRLAVKKSVIEEWFELVEETGVKSSEDMVDAVTSRREGGRSLGYVAKL